MQQITFEQMPEALARVLSELSELRGLITQQQQQPTEQHDQLLTIQQAAELLTLSVPTIYGLVNRSAIPYSKPGKRLYFSKQELTEWIKSGRKKTTAEIEAEATNYVNRKGR